MSTLKHFGQAVEGQLPETAKASHAVVMGKELGPDAVMSIAAVIGRAVEDGVARPVNALAANVIATPSGGLEPKGHETQTYRYNAAEMFGVTPD